MSGHIVDTIVAKDCEPELDEVSVVSELSQGSNGALGKTKSPSWERKRAVHWCFRVSVSKCPCVQIFVKSIEEFVVEFVFQEEEGSNSCKIRHYQGCFSLPKKMLATGVHKALFSFIGQESFKCGAEYLAPMNSTRGIDYCCKDDTRKGGPWGSKGYLERQGVYDERQMEEMGIISTRGLPTWALWVLELIEGRADKRTIHWFWSRKGGVGKTSLAKLICFKDKRALFVGNGSARHVKSAVFKSKPEVIIMGLPRETDTSAVSYRTLEEVKDGLFFSGFGTETTGMVVMKCPHIIVLANAPPKVERMSADRWHIVELGKFHEELLGVPEADDVEI